MLSVTNVLCDHRAGNERLCYGHTRWSAANEFEEWLDAAQSSFVRDENAHTPMGSGILAFADEARARARVGRADSLQWGALQRTASAASTAGECCNDSTKPSSNTVAQSHQKMP
jgi:hypothetical protein